ncbi:MAG: NPCBM/NEW2 domain-containing protein [Armatimonadota bacterium]
MTVVSNACGDVSRVSFDQSDDLIMIKAHGLSLPISLQAPSLGLGDVVTVREKPCSVKGRLNDRQIVEASYVPIPVGDAHLEMKLFLKWSPKESVLRKWARFRLTGGKAPILLKDVLLDDINLDGRKAWTHGGRVSSRTYTISDYSQSHPVFVEGFFAGIEYPVSVTRHENGHLLVEHKPGVWLQPGKWYESRKAVYGTASVGHERQAFERYISLHRPKSAGFHINYNSWWTSPVPYTEKDILELISAFDKNLYKKNGVSLDTFCIDLGWSKKESVWEIDKGLFPDGFSKIEAVAQKMGSNIGLWISPCSGYPEALDNNWLEKQGYETVTIPINGTDWKFACLGGKKYAAAFHDRLVEMVTRYGVRHIKFDGNILQCVATNHGHEPHPLSSEAITEGLINTFQGVHKAAPDAWLEPTCFGNNASPWWLFYVNSVMGSVGADAPIGRVPCPVYREGYTSSRDFYNFMGAELVPMPTAGMEVLGLIHQTQEDFTNDGVMTVMRGNMFLPLYMNPKFMNDTRWQSLARLLKWARSNAGILQDTAPLLPASWQSGNIPLLTDTQPVPRDPYGYAHLSVNRGMIVLRNPWIAPQTYALKLDETIGLNAAASRMSAVSIYPESRIYGEDLHFGDTLNVRLAPYETVVISISPRNQLRNLSSAGSTYLKVTDMQHKLSRVEFDTTEPAIGPNWSSTLGDVSSVLKLNLEGTVEVESPQARLLLLFEGNTSPAMNSYTVKVNGKDAAAQVLSSSAGWYAGLPSTDHWTFLQVPLKTGSSRISAVVMVGNDCTKVSAWVWATKPGINNSQNQNALSQPELISLDGACLLEPVEISTIAVDPVKIQRPVERINGIFLDTMEPESVSQGWSTLQKNRSVWEKPMVIGGRQFMRGLGTHAESRIVYAIDGKFQRFQCWVGADGNNSPSIGFEVLVDGRSIWKSRLMTRDDQAKQVDVDITGGKTLELLVSDGGNGIGGDHADWADAKLLY